MNLYFKKKASALVKAAAVVCDIAAMPFRAVAYDLRAGYNELPRASQPVRVGNAMCRASLTCILPLTPFVAGWMTRKVCPVEGFETFLNALTGATAFLFTYVAAWEHPFVPCARENWERFPLMKKWNERVSNFCLGAG